MCPHQDILAARVSNFLADRWTCDSEMTCRNACRRNVSPSHLAHTRHNGRKEGPDAQTTIPRSSSSSSSPIAAVVLASAVFTTYNRCVDVLSNILDGTLEGTCIVTLPFPG